MVSAIEPVRDGVTVYREWFDAAAIHELATEAWGHLLHGIRVGVPEQNLDVLPERRFFEDRRIVNSVGEQSPVYDAFAERLPVGGEQARDSPQQIAHFPGSSGMPVHRDLLGCRGPFAGWKYHYIVGIALTPSRVGSGCLCVVGAASDDIPVELDPGDVVVLRSDVAHRVEPNRSTSPRVAFYFRFACAPDEILRFAASLER